MLAAGAGSGHTVLGSVPTSRSADEFGTAECDGVQGTTSGVGDIGVGSDDDQEVSEAGRGSSDVGGLGVQVGHAGSEHHESASTWQRGSGSEQTAEPGGASLVGNGLGEGVVVTDKVGLGDAQCGDHGRRREVQNLEVMDVCRADPAEHLEGVYAAVEEVAEQLSPRCLLLV